MARVAEGWEGLGIEADGGCEERTQFRCFGFGLFGLRIGAGGFDLSGGGLGWAREEGTRVLGDLRTGFRFRYFNGFVGMRAAGLLEAAEFLAGVLVGAFSESDAALQPHEDRAAGVAGFTQLDAFAMVGSESVEFPEMGLDPKETAQHPFAADEGVDLEALLGGKGLEALGVFALQYGEILAGFAEDELEFGIEAGFEGVPGRHGLAFDGARSGRFLRVEAVGLNLTLRRHRNGWRPAMKPALASR